MLKNENLVMIHGLLGSLSFFEPEKYLAEINVFTPDMHNYGNSPSIENLSLQDQAGYIEEFIVTKVKEPTWILGHSLGGAIATIVASQNPKIIKGIINVEGNFSLNDAFWCQRIAETNEDVWAREYAEICADPENWLKDSDIAVTPERLKWAIEILGYQTAKAAQQVATAVIKGTGTESYANQLNSVIQSNIPVHLLAGEFSKKGWDVPEAYMSSASGYHTIESTGHMMMLEQPKVFCDVIKNIINQT